MKSKKEQKKVLVVDDNDHMARCLAEMVDIFGIPCETANSGEEAIEKMKNREYALVIADTKMSGISGFTLLKYVKRNYPKTSVAIISTRNSDATQGMVVRDMPDFYLPKPFKTSDVEEILADFR